ncbi:MAG: HupE/UreJ family protein, partial [Pseudomonadota bacterium]
AIPLLAAAHPEDEFCLPGQPGIDPALCRAIAALQQSDVGSAATVLQPLTDESGNVRGFWSTFGLYTSIGVDHILPGGLDHILFVIALCLASTRLRALVIQISTFTVAHTATLGLAAAGIIAPPASVVEPLIAATIAFVAVENLIFRDMNRWRPLIVFGFGLIHGLGFAGFFGELGLPPNQFWSALLGFNLGVEIGQLSVVAGVLLLSTLLLRMHHEPVTAERRYRQLLVVPASLAIAATGAWWAVTRVLSSG